MKTHPDTHSRRSFIQFLALNSTVLAFSPQLLVEQNTHPISIGFLNTVGHRKEKLSSIFKKKRGVAISKSINTSNIIYVDKPLLSEIRILQEALDANKHLIINTTNIDSELFSALQNLDRPNEQLLILAEIMFDDKHIVFQKTTMYESLSHETKKIDEKLKILDFLSLFTINHKFFIEKPNIE